MRLVRLGFLLASLCAAPSSAYAAISNLLGPSETGVNGALLSQSPKMAIRVSGYSAVSVYVSLSRAGATAVNMVCTSGPTNLVQASIAVAQIDSTSGLITMMPASWTYPVSANGMVRMLVAPINDTYLVCQFSGPGATSDTVSVYAQMGG